MKLSARAVFALLSLDKEWSQSVRVSICCSVRSILGHCCSRSYVAAQGSNRRQMCLLPPSRASNNILKGKIYRPSLLPFLSLSLSLSLQPSAFYFLFPHLSHRNLYNFYRILLSASAWYRLLCFAHAAQRCTVVQFLSLPPAIISPTTHLFIPCYT